MNRDFSLSCLKSDTISQQVQIDYVSVDTRKGSTNSNMGQCIYIYLHSMDKENRYDCVAGICLLAHTHTHTHSVLQDVKRISCIDRRRNGKWAHAVNNVYYQNAKDFGVIDETPRISICVKFDTRMCAECCRFFVFFLFSILSEQTFRRSHSDTHTNAHGKWQRFCIQKHTWNCFYASRARQLRSLRVSPLSSVDYHAVYLHILCIYNIHIEILSFQTGR